MNESVKEKLAAEIGRRLTPQPVKISAYFEVNCFAKEGVDAIKEALREAEALSTPDIKISVNLITPPMFSVSTMALLNKKKAFELIETSLKVIEEGIKKRGGSYKLKKAPQRVDKNEKEMEERLLEDEDANDGEQYQIEDDEDN